MSFSNVCLQGERVNSYFTHLSRCDTPHQSGGVVRILNWMRGKNPFSFPSDKGKSPGLSLSLSHFQSLPINPRGSEGSIKPLEEVSLIDTGFFPRILQIILLRSTARNPVGISGCFPPLFFSRESGCCWRHRYGLFFHHCSQMEGFGLLQHVTFLSPTMLLIWAKFIYWSTRPPAASLS